jgi:hypothetical protein
MARTHHSHRRQKQARHAARLRIAGGVIGVLSTVAGLIVVVRAHGDRAEPIPRAVASRTSATTVRGTVSDGVKSW